VPLVLFKEKFDQIVVNKLNLPDRKIKLEDWEKLVENIKDPVDTVEIALCGKYTDHLDAYKSIMESFVHAGAENNTKVIVRQVKAEELDDVRDFSTVENTHSFIANGIIVHNSAQRFARLREGAYVEHFKKIAEYMKEQFLHLGNDLKGIIIGGPGTTVNDFLNHDYITGDIKKKILGTKDLSYTEEFGLHELLDKCDDILAAEEVAQEKKVVQRFLKQLLDNPKKAAYGEAEIRRTLAMNAVDLLLISDSIPEEKIFDLEAKAEVGGAQVIIISVETREGAQLRDMGGFGAILRYEVE